VKWLSRIAVDVQPLRESRDFRLLTAGSLITGLGTQATLVALPYQVFVITGSAFLTGLLGAAELGPLIVASLFGGALADRFDRRRMLMFCQFALVAIAAALAALRRPVRRRSGSSSSSPPRWPAPRRSSGWCARRPSPTPSPTSGCRRRSRSPTASTS
jgi:Transmembrane secretion effector